MRSRLLTLFFGLCLSPVLLAAGAGASLQSFLDGAQSVSAQFEQKLFNEKGKLLETSTGTLIIKRPGKFRWHYKDPFEQEIIADGAKIWIYDPDLQQVSVKPMGRAVGGSPAILLSTDRRLSELFDMRDGASVDGVDWVVLKPLELNKELADDTFVFAPPKGSDVIVDEPLGPDK